MQTTTFTEFRNNASHYLNLAEQGESIVIIRHGKPIAELKPIASNQKTPSWKSAGLDISIPGVSLSAEILKQRKEENK
ncbi:MAG: type II toxin-antitoxin system Phd/YefM family antitoxin [Legionellales bacterium]|jgi:prevent-host-death family protein